MGGQSSATDKSSSDSVLKQWGMLSMVLILLSARKRQGDSKGVGKGLISGVVTEDIEGKLVAALGGAEESRASKAWKLVL